MSFLRDQQADPTWRGFSSGSEQQDRYVRVLSHAERVLVLSGRYGCPSRASVVEDDPSRPPGPYADTTGRWLKPHPLSPCSSAGWRAEVRVPLAHFS